MPVFSASAEDVDISIAGVERRCVSGENGAAWQPAAFHRLYDEGLERREALRRMTVL